MRIFSTAAFVFLSLLVFVPLAYAGDDETQHHPQQLSTDALVFYAYILKNNPRQMKRLSYELALVSDKVAVKTGIPIELIAAIQKVESNFQVMAVSPKNAMGPMQVHYPTWGPKLKLTSETKWALFVPAVNVLMGASILKMYLEKENFDLRNALYRYLGMPNARLAQLPVSLRGKKNAERVNYVNSILREYAKYKKFKSNILSRLNPIVDRAETIEGGGQSMRPKKL